MRKHAEMFHAIKGYKWKMSFYSNVNVFKIEICGTLCKHQLHKNKALHTPTFYVKKNHFNIVFYMT